MRDRDSDHEEVSNDQSADRNRDRNVASLTVPTATPKVLGEIGQSDATGVVGRATDSSSLTYGVYGETQSTYDDSVGVLGDATASSRTTYGVHGRTASTDYFAAGVRGAADGGGSATTYGVHGTTDSTGGTGVFGQATATSGIVSGVRGETYSEGFGATGVEGEARNTSGTTFGVFGGNDSTDGAGVRGVARASSGNTDGVAGVSKSYEGTGVYGSADASTGYVEGVYGRSESPNGRGVSGYNSSTSGNAYGVEGQTQSESGAAVRAYAAASSGTNYGVYAETTSDEGYAVFADGRLHAERYVKQTGATNLGRHVATFVNTHPDDGGDILGLKKENTSDPSRFTNYVSFLDQDSQIGQIQGNDSGGVDYQSASADLAEYFPVADAGASFAAGEVVGLAAGELVADPTRRDVDAALVVSDAPMVTGNAPADGDDDGLARVALLGQVPVGVRAPVAAGDRLVATADGAAVPATDREESAPVVGRALESGSSDDSVEVLVGAGTTLAHDSGRVPSPGESDTRAAALAELEAENEALRERNADLERRLAVVETELGLDGSTGQSTPADD